MERVKAQPGSIFCLIQMRGGSPESSSSLSSPAPASVQSSCIGSSPSIWSMLATTAPTALQRSRSSFRKGVWSDESGYAISLPFRSSPMMARESPTLAT